VPKTQADTYPGGRLPMKIPAMEQTESISDVLGFYPVNTDTFE
jgi:hypothetical protein